MADTCTSQFLIPPRTLLVTALVSALVYRRVAVSWLAWRSLTGSGLGLDVRSGTTGVSGCPLPSPLTGRCAGGAGGGRGGWRGRCGAGGQFRGISTIVHNAGVCETRRTVTIAVWVCRPPDTTPSPEIHGFLVGLINRAHSMLNGYHVAPYPSVALFTFFGLEHCSDSNHERFPF